MFFHFCFTYGVLCNDVELKKQPFNNTFGLLADGHQETSRERMLGDDHLTLSSLQSRCEDRNVPGDFKFAGNKFFCLFHFLM